MTKKLFILVSDHGDGSYSPVFTFNEAWIKEQEESGEYDSDAPGWDGDGFHYTILMVPDECTYESLGISEWSVADKYD